MDQKSSLPKHMTGDLGIQYGRQEMGGSNKVSATKDWDGVISLQESLFRSKCSIKAEGICEKQARREMMIFRGRFGKGEL